MVELEEAAVEVVELSLQAFPMVELLGAWELHQPPEAPRSVVLSVFCLQGKLEAQEGRFEAVPKYQK